MPVSKLSPKDLAELAALGKVAKSSSTQTGDAPYLTKENQTIRSGLTTVLRDDSPLPAPEPSVELPANLQQVPLTSSYPGAAELLPEENKPLREDGYTTVISEDGTVTTLDFYPTPAHLIAMHMEQIRTGSVTLHSWQVEQGEEFSQSFKWATSENPYKLALCAANGSGKDAFVIAPGIVWAAFTNLKCLVLITSSSGTQLTSQTENYIKSLCLSINTYYGVEFFRVRQRFIRCNLTGSEIRLFATDEAGKAEGYHPLEPGAKMIICVNEAKSVSEDIFGALKRCNGYTHWMNVSTPGEPKGSFYRACTNEALKYKFRRVTSYDCPHLFEHDREADRIELGQTSALYRSKHLALFTSIGGTCVISDDIINAILLEPPNLVVSLPTRIGIDLAAGGDENVLCFSRGAKVLKEVWFQEVDTTITADRIEGYLKENGISKTHEYIFADDGGVGHGIIDNLVRRGWTINRVLNQSSAMKRKMYGNRGAELWYTAKRLLEERIINISALSPKTIEQLTSRQYKQVETGGRIFLESKKEAKAHGRPSPDRADAFILSLFGLSIDDFIDAKPTEEVTPKRQRMSSEEMESWFDENVVYNPEYKGNMPSQENSGTTRKKLYNSLDTALRELGHN